MGLAALGLGLTLAMHPSRVYFVGEDPDTCKVPRIALKT